MNRLFPSTSFPFQYHDYALFHLPSKYSITNQNSYFFFLSLVSLNLFNLLPVALYALHPSIILHIAKTFLDHKYAMSLITLCHYPARCSATFLCTFCCTFSSAILSHPISFHFTLLHQTDIPHVMNGNHFT